jgi:dolichyl-phosphate-mannose--protein O-mannosyl transferase
MPPTQESADMPPKLESQHADELTKSDSEDTGSGKKLNLQRSFTINRAWTSWLFTLLVGSLALYLRLKDAFVARFLFDEKYYIPDSWTLTHLGYEARLKVNSLVPFMLSQGTPDSENLSKYFISTPTTIYHPPLGKWIIGLGELAFGMTAQGWRISVIILSTLTVLVLMRASLRLTGSLVVATCAGVFLAVDTLSIVIGRIGILDPILTFFIVCAFWAVTGWMKAPGGRPRTYWILAFGVFSGLAFSVKWSAAWFILGFLLFMLVSIVKDRRDKGQKTPFKLVFRRGFARVTQVIIPVIVIYVTSWTGWFASSGGLMRHTTGLGFDAPPILEPIWNWLVLQYYMLYVNVSLVGYDNYSSHPTGWWIPSKAIWLAVNENVGPNGGCNGNECWGEIALGNPFIWWFGGIAVLYAVYRAWRKRDRASMLVAFAVAFGYLPWFLSWNRMAYQYYMVVIGPFVALALAMAVERLARKILPGKDKRPLRLALITTFLGMCLAYVVWLWPVMTAQIMTPDDFHARLWNIQMWYPQIPKETPPIPGHPWPPWKQ